MSNSNAIIPITDAQARAIEEALRTLQGFGGFLRETFGTVPQDIVGLLGGDWLKVRRAENLAHILEKARERLRARRVETPEAASLSITLPILIAAADESRDELQDIWASLLAAAADPARAKSFRIRFIEVVKKMDPLDATILNYAKEAGGGFTGQIRNDAAAKLHASRDEVDVSIANLEKLELMHNAGPVTTTLLPLGRELLRTLSD